MSSPLPVSLLAFAATVGAQTYAPLLPAPDTEFYYPSLVAPNYFGGGITATLSTTTDGLPGNLYLFGDVGVNSIDGNAVGPAVDGAPIHLTFSESITRLVLGWFGNTGEPGFTFSVFDGATQVDAGSVITLVDDGFSSQAYLDFIRPAGFTSITIDIAGNGVYAIGYGTPAVPEPSTYGLILGGLALAGAALRRRKNSR